MHINKHHSLYDQWERILSVSMNDMKICRGLGPDMISHSNRSVAVTWKMLASDSQTSL